MATAFREKKVILCIISILHLASTENKTFVMKLSGDNLTVNAQPKILISQYNNEMKERNKIKAPNPETDKIVNEIVTNKENETYPIRNSEVSFTQGPEIQNLNFPYNLQVVEDVLKKIKNGHCVRDTSLVLEAMTRHERWSLEMFDSFPKFPVGILHGNYYQLGNFDECVEARRPEATADSSTDGLVRGQYCLVDVTFGRKNSGGNGRVARTSKDGLENADVPNRRMFNSSVIHWGVCLPSSCTTGDTTLFVQNIFSSVVESFTVVSVRVDSNKCYYEKTVPYTSLEIIYGCVLGTFLIFTVLATGFHCWYIRQRKRCVAYSIETVRNQTPNIFNEIIVCFSFINTTGKLLQTKPNELNLECICGLKFLSMSLIIAGHSLVFLMGGPIVNTKFFEETSTKVENSLLINSPLLVDTFLFISGFLMCRLLLIEFEKRKGKVNFLILYIARYIRLTPAYLVVIGLYMTLLYRTGSGPFWESRINLEKERCLKSWWTNLLYLNNYVNTDQLCMFQSWYLAVDYHLFIIAPFLIYLLWKWRKIGESFLFLCTIISVAVPFWITYRDNLDPTLMAYPPEIADISTNFYFVNAYMKTHMRASSYCIGLVFGCLVHRLQSSGTKISSYIIWVGLVLAACLGVMSMYSIVIFYHPSHIENNLESAIYASLHRVAWCLGIGWVLVVCITDNAAIINRFLSWKAFIPASRLSYCAYLANGIVEIHHMGVLRQPTYLSKYELAYKILGHLLITYTLAFLLCIFFESPIHGLEKLLLRKEKVKEQKQHSTLRRVEET